MEEYTPDIFYDVNALSLPDKIDLLNSVKSVCYDQMVRGYINDMWQRTVIDISFDEVMKGIKEDSFMAFVHRRGYPDNGGIWKWRLECVLVDESERQLIMCAEPEYVEKFVNEYKLNKLS